MDRDPLTEKIIGCAIEVHKALGPGLLESAYEKCLSHELKLQSIDCLTEYQIPVSYKGLNLDCGYRADIVIPDKLIIELKAVDKVHDVCKAQILTYMKLTGVSTGLLINFNVTRLVEGITRFKI